MMIVVEANVDRTYRFKLLEPKSGFDSTFIWSLRDEDDPDKAYLLCIQLPVSGRTPIPSEYKSMFLWPQLTARMSTTSLWIYDMTDHLTLAEWRGKRGKPDPDEVYEIASRLATSLKRLHRDKHCLLRFNADTVVLEDDILYRITVEDGGSCMNGFVQ